LISHLVLSLSSIFFWCTTCVHILFSVSHLVSLFSHLFHILFDSLLDVLFYCFHILFLVFTSWLKLLFTSCVQACFVIAVHIFVFVSCSHLFRIFHIVFILFSHLVCLFSHLFFSHITCLVGQAPLRDAILDNDVVAGKSFLDQKTVAGLFCLQKDENLFY
jgi:hypothetical protein